MYQGIMYLNKKDLKYDKKSSTAALLGTIFCILATISGSIFAKQTWGMYWNWDPRETSIIALLLVYLAYFSLRSAVADAVRKANLSAVYSILGFIAAIFTIFIWPRIVPGLHPGAPGGSTGSFIVMSPETWMVFGPSMAAFIGLYLWLYSLSIRVAQLQRGD
jgi:heme exporter protein C